MAALSDFLNYCFSCDSGENDTEQSFLEFCGAETHSVQSEARHVAPKQHAFGQWRGSTSTSFCTVVSSTSPDSDDVEVEDVVQSGLTILRGKKPREPKSVKRVEVPLKKKLFNMEPGNIASALQPCCAKNCFTHFNYYDVEAVRAEFWNLNRAKQLDWLTRQLAFWGRADENVGTFKFRYLLQNKQCCATFFESALPVSHGRLSLARNRVLTDQLEDSQKDASPVNTFKSDSAEEFIRTYARLHGQGMPNSVDVNLPNGKTKDSVYCDFLVERSDGTKEGVDALIGLSGWYRVWRERCFHVKTPKWQKFSKCTTCSNIKTLREFTDASKRGEHPNLLTCFAF